MINPDSWGLSPKRKTVRSAKIRRAIRATNKSAKPAPAPKSATGGCWPSPWGNGTWKNPLGD